MSGTSVELLPTRLFRAAQGNRPHEAAIALLAKTGVLNQLSCCIVLDPDRNLAWIDWPALTVIAGRAKPDIRAILQLAATIATDGQHLTPNDHRALRVAVDHLATQRH